MTGSFGVIQKEITFNNTVLRKKSDLEWSLFERSDFFPLGSNPMLTQITGLATKLTIGSPHSHNQVRIISQKQRH